jgi:zinc transporter 1/2/3
MYSLTLPAGIAIGILVASSYDAGSRLAAGLQGGLSAFSAGLLLHLGMYSMVGEELGRHDLLGRPGLAAAVFGAVGLGVGGMAVIALWG